MESIGQLVLTHRIRLRREDPARQRIERGCPAEAPGIGFDGTIEGVQTEYLLGSAIKVGVVGGYVGGVSGGDEPGYSGRVSTRLPLFGRSLSLTSSAGFRFLEPDARRSFSMSDVSLIANWRRGPALSMFVAATHSFGANDDGDNEETVFQMGTQVV